MAAGLVLGSFNMSDPVGSAWKAGVEAEGTSRGAPASLEVAVQSWLQNGSIVITQGYDNRELAIRVRLWATSLAALNNAEAALFAELGKPNTLTWTPPSGPASVFVVVTSSMAEDDSRPNADLIESQRLIRTYNVRLLCEAFTRSTAEVVAVSLPATGSTHTTLDTMGATTGWTGFVNGGSTAVVNTVGPPTTNSVSSASTSGATVVAMQKTFAATTSTTKLLVVDWKPSVTVGPTAGLSAIGDGVTLGLVAEQASPTSGYVRTYFYVAANSLAVLRLEWTSSALVPTQARTLTLDNIEVTNTQPTTGRQQMRSLTVVGSAPASGTFAIESGSAALGDGTLIYTFPSQGSNGYTPSLRQFRIAGGTVTTDAAMVSGARESAGGLGVTFSIPNNLLPAGSYLLLARMALSTGGSSGNLAVALGSSYPVSGTTTYTSTASLTSVYKTLTVGRFILPTVDVPAVSTSATSVNLTATGWGAATPLLDEVWLFNTTIGQLVQVNCGTGAGSVGGFARRLFIDPPNISTPRPTIRMGHSADRSDAFYPSSPAGSVLAWQQPRFPTPQVNVFVVTPNATDAVVTLSHYPRWHTNAAS